MDISTPALSDLDQLVERYQKPTSSILESLEKYRALDDAVTTLTSERFQEFCLRVGLAQSSEQFRYQHRLGNRYGRWVAALGHERIGVAFLYLFSVSDFEFDKMLSESTELMKDLEQADDYTGPGMHTAMH